MTAAPKGSTISVATFTVSAAPKPKQGVDWDPLRAFPIALTALLGAALRFYIIWDATDDEDHKINEPLKHLEATWSFKDRWVSNITVGAALLTGIFGSADVVTVLLGKDAKDAVALATVGAAIAAAFAAAGPILLAATKKKGMVTVGGLLAASALTLTGAAAQIYTVYASARLLDLGGWQDKVYILAIIAAALLTAYAVRTLHEVLGQGVDLVRRRPAGRSATGSPIGDRPQQFSSPLVQEECAHLFCTHGHGEQQVHRHGVWTPHRLGSWPIPCGRGCCRLCASMAPRRRLISLRSW